MIRNISKKLQRCCLLLISVSVIACGGLTRSDQPVTRIWWLNPYEDVAHTEHTEIISPIEVTVSVVPGLDTAQILTLSDSLELKSYAGARWVGDLPELVKSLTIRSLLASARFVSASTRASTDAKPCRLQLELREFFGFLDAQGLTTRVQIAVGGRYQCETGASMDIQFTATEPVHDNRMKTIVAAFQQATDSMMRNLLSQLP